MLPYTAALLMLSHVAGTVEAGAGVTGETAKRERSDDMAALEADLAPEPQAGQSASSLDLKSMHYAYVMCIVSSMFCASYAFHLMQNK